MGYFNFDGVNEVLESAIPSRASVLGIFIAVFFTGILIGYLI